MEPSRKFLNIHKCSYAVDIMNTDNNYIILEFMNFSYYGVTIVDREL